MLLFIFARRPSRSPGEGEGQLPGAKLDDVSRGAGIRCPKCRWKPRPGDHWHCSCGHAWNTFDTRGLCPACKHQWEDTQCPACHRWSRHADWYGD